MAVPLESVPLPLDATVRSTPPRQTFPWPAVLCLLGLDYFSTLAYQPSITYAVAGPLGPVATGVVVLLTLLGALPVYAYLAARSPRGQGSLAVYEHLFHGWRGKTLVLVLLGFAATDFTMLKTISLADAAVHVLNQHDDFRRARLHEFAGWMQGHAIHMLGPAVGPHLDEQLVATLFLGVLCFLCWFLLRRGFSRNVVRLSVPLVTTYLGLTGLLLIGGLWRLSERLDLVQEWLNHVQAFAWQETAPLLLPAGWSSIALVSVLFLPNLALGLSGFELSLIVEPQVEGRSGESESCPRTRIRNTRRVLVSAALIMGVYLLSAVFVTALLIPAAELGTTGRATNRSLAYLAHGGPLVDEMAPLLPFCGLIFGTLYDFVTVLVLCLAGTSVMTALSALLPNFLSRLGMEFDRARRWGITILIFAGINTVVTVLFKASVEAQRGAYATAVLTLIVAACIATVYDKKKRYEDRPTGPWFWLGWSYFVLVALVFGLTLLAVAVRSPSGLLIALGFIAALLAMSVVSRALRADELRTVGYAFKDETSKFLWDSLRLADFPVLVPKRPSRDDRGVTEQHIRAAHQLAADADIVFLEVAVDDPSNFYQRPTIEVVRAESRYVIRVTGCVSVAHTIAAVSLEMSRSSRPPGIHFGWPEIDMLSASWSYLAFGEGNIPWKVRELIHRAEPDAAKRPRVIVG